MNAFSVKLLFETSIFVISTFNHQLIPSIGVFGLNTSSGIESNFVLLKSIYPFIFACFNFVFAALFDLG